MCAAPSAHTFRRHLSQHCNIWVVSGTCSSSGSWTSVEVSRAGCFRVTSSPLRDRFVTASKPRPVKSRPWIVIVCHDFMQALRSVCACFHGFGNRDASRMRFLRCLFLARALRPANRYGNSSCTADQAVGNKLDNVKINGNCALQKKRSLAHDKGPLLLCGYELS